MVSCGIRGGCGAMLGGFGGIALDALGGVMVLSTSSAENFLGSLVIDQQIFEL
jgi:anaerobic glycerol-3-phosphate dehydrogenase